MKFLLKNITDYRVRSCEVVSVVLKILEDVYLSFTSVLVMYLLLYISIVIFSRKRSK